MRAWADNWSPRTCAQDEADFMGDIVSLIAYLKSEPSLADSKVVTFGSDFYVDASGTPGERKARADRMAERWKATTGWRNGYYFATRDLFGAEDVTVELHFTPPIMAADLEVDAA
jgi:hypothetical protein